MKKNNDVTPPPRRVTQELFTINDAGETIPTATLQAEKTVASEKPDADFNDDALPATPQKFSPASTGPFAKLLDSNFIQFASYTICNRAIPTVEDGLKPVQRRILHSLYEKDDGRFTKVASIIGHTMQYHPHGDASIGDALVNLANKRYLIEGQGNFGNIYTGDGAAASRYIECRLTELARKEIFNKKTTEYIPSYDQRNMEPVLLPSKLPILLMLGAEGIAVGLSTKILPHNFIELLNAMIAIIQNKPFVVLPDFQTGGLLDVSEYNDGVGRIRVRARIEPRGNNTVVITELPFGQTTENMISSIEDAARRKKVPVKAIHDATSDKAEIIISLSPGADIEKAIQSLYAFTSCENSITANMVVIENNRPCERTVSQVLHSNVKQLMFLLERELQIRKDELYDAMHKKTLVQIFVEERIYKRIEKCTSYEQIQTEILKGFEPFKDRLIRDITNDDIEMLLGVQIRRISLFDINKNKKDIEDILEELKQVEKDLSSMKAYSVKYLKDLIKEYQFVETEVEVEESDEESDNKKKATAKKTPKNKKTKKAIVERFPRLTKITTFDTIEVREITASELTVFYDKQTGFLGHAVKTGEELFKCSSLDKLIIVWPDGKYKLVPVPDKMFVDKQVLYTAIFDRDKLYTVVYTENEYPFSCLKRFSFGGLIMNRDYTILPDPGTVRIFAEGTPERIWIKYKPAKGQRILQKVFSPENEIAVKGVKSKGRQITSKPIQYISADGNTPRWWDEDASTDQGKLL